MSDIREYVVYEMPNGDILLDWDDTTWRFGYPYCAKSKCRELERGMCKGGPNLPLLEAQMREKYRNETTI